MTDKRRSFAWALEPSWDVPAGASQRWWLVEMEDGEPVRGPEPEDCTLHGSASEAAADFGERYAAWKDAQR